jgi:NADH-quinone oxidoreductase subunit G
MIGPHVIADMTRCIQCTRCIRFCHEIAETSELTFLDRGGRTLVWTHDGKPLANDWSGCAADVCPVGALTVKEFRFRKRVWYLDKTPSICPGCNIGCNISIESRDNVVYRFLPRFQPAVNDYWICDHGRFLSESLNTQDVEKATVRDGNEVRDVHVPDGIERIRKEIRSAVESTGPAALFFVGSARLSNEENFLLRKISEHLACPNRDVKADRSRTRRMKSQKGWIEGEDAAANLRGARDMGVTPGSGGYGLDDVLSGKSKPEIIIFADANFADLADDAEKVAALRKARFLAVCARTANALTRAADVVLPAASLAEKEGTFTNVQGRVQKFERAFLPRPPVQAHWELLLLLALSLGWGDRAWTPTDILSLIAQEVGAYAKINDKELEGGYLLKKGDFPWKGRP